MSDSTTEREGRALRGRSSVRPTFSRLVVVAFAALLALAVAACTPTQTGPTGSTTTTLPSTTTTTVPLSTAVGGLYSVNFATAGTVLISQFGTGASSVYTVSVVKPFEIEGATCSLAPSAVIATFTGAGPAFPQSIDWFTTPACTHNGTTGSTAHLNTDGSIDIGTPTGVHRLTKIANASPVVNPTVAGNYSVNFNGSVGAVTVSQSGTGTASVYTVSVTTPFKLEGATCSLAPNAVSATFTGAGPALPQSIDWYTATTCAPNGTTGSTAYLNTDNSITLATGVGYEHLTKM